MAYKAKVWDGSEWVEISAQPADLSGYVSKTGTTGDIDLTSADSINVNGVSGVPLSYRNKIINGSMSVWQRGTSFVSNGYTADRFRGNNGTYAQSTDVPDGFTYSLHGSSLSTPIIEHGLELPDTGIKGYITGTHTISFYAKFDLGKTMYFASWFADSAGGGNQVTVVDYNGSTTPSFVGTGAWERYTFTFDISQTPNATNKCLRFTWLNLNSGFTLNNFRITGVQLEKGEVATEFEFEPHVTTLAKCQRYYWRSQQGTNWASYGIGRANSTTSMPCFFTFPTTMRTPPSSVEYQNLCAHHPGVVAYNFTALTIVEGSTVGADCVATVASGLTTASYYHVSNNGTAGGYIAFSAEL